MLARGNRFNFNKHDPGPNVISIQYPVTAIKFSAIPSQVLELQRKQKTAFLIMHWYNWKPANTARWDTKSSTAIVQMREEPEAEYLVQDHERESQSLDFKARWAPSPHAQCLHGITAQDLQYPSALLPGTQLAALLTNLVTLRQYCFISLVSTASLLGAGSSSSDEEVFREPMLHVLRQA